MQWLTIHLEEFPIYFPARIRKYTYMHMGDIISVRRATIIANPQDG